jgi:integrase
MGAYLQRSRHGTIFYFRRKLPLDLRQHAGVPQFYLSLGTADRPTALILARRAATLCDELFATFKHMAKKNTNEDLMRLIEQRRLTGPLKEEIERLRDELLESHFQRNKAVKKLHEEHAGQLAALVTRAASSTAAIATAQSKFSVATAIKTYLGKPMKPQARKRIGAALRHFEAFAGGSTPLHVIDQARIADYSDTVNSSSAWTTATKNLYITSAASMVNWHRQRGDPPGTRVSAATLKIKRTKPTALDRDAFTLGQLQVIFEEAAAFRVKEPHWFWAVVMSAFMGTRIEELAQADIKSDFKKDGATGRWYLDINETVGPGGHKKSVKKESGWRVVPLHQELIQLGFPGYLERQKRSGARTLFESGWKPLASAEKDSFKFSHGITKRGSRALARLAREGRIAKGKTSFFHSLRHTFITHLAEKKVDAEMRSAITGHAVEGGGMNASRYTKLKAQVQPKLAAIDDNLEEFVDRLRVALSSKS